MFYIVFGKKLNKIKRNISAYPRVKKGYKQADVSGLIICAS